MSINEEFLKTTLNYKNKLEQPIFELKNNKLTQLYRNTHNEIKINPNINYKFFNQHYKFHSCYKKITKFIILPFKKYIQTNQSIEKQNNKSNFCQKKQCLITKVYKSTQTINFQQRKSLPFIRKSRKQKFGQLQKHIKTSISNKYFIKPIIKRQSQERNVSKVSNTFQKQKQMPQLIYRCYLQMPFLINLSNDIYFTNKNKIYKAVINHGNNDTLIKSVLKKRWWWIIVSKKEKKINLLWTQWKNNFFINNLPQNQQSSLYSFINNKRQVQSKQICRNKRQNQKLYRFRKMKIQKIIEIKKYPVLQQKISSDLQSNFFTNSLDQNIFKQYSQINNQITQIINKDCMIHNHLENGHLLHSKKNLILILREYYSLQQLFIRKKLEIQTRIPKTFVIKNGKNDQEYKIFQKLYYYNKIQTGETQNKNNTSNIWIIKPGQKSNQGNGIIISDNIVKIKQKVQQVRNGSIIIQEYITKPLLYEKRKFDIRCFILITKVNNYFKSYWYEQGYIRTSSFQYNLNNISNRITHLTNDAVQKKGQYGKFQRCNKLSFNDFQKKIKTTQQKFSIFECFDQMKQIAKQISDAIANKIDPNNRAYTFQLFGLDIMINQNFRPVLLQINSNPSLNTNGQVLSQLIPDLIENVFKIAIDPLFPPPNKLSKMKMKELKGKGLNQNKFNLIFSKKIKIQNEANILKKF